MMKLNVFFAVFFSLGIAWAINQYQQYATLDNAAPALALIVSMVLCVIIVTWRMISFCTAAARSFFFGAVLVSLSVPMTLALNGYYTGNRPYIFAGIPILFGAMLMVIGWEMRIPGKMVFVRNMIHGGEYCTCTTCGLIVTEAHILFDSLTKEGSDHSCPTKCWWW